MLIFCHFMYFLVYLQFATVFSCGKHCFLHYKLKEFRVWPLNFMWKRVFLAESENNVGNLVFFTKFQMENGYPIGFRIGKMMVIACLGNAEFAIPPQR